MSAPAVARAVAGGLGRRRVQTAVIGLVIGVSTAASTLAVGLLADSNGPFQHAFTAQHGAHLMAVIDPGKASAAQLAATTRLPAVTGAAGPFPEAAAVITVGNYSRPSPATLAGRTTPGGPVDDLSLDAGRWPHRPGEIVLSGDYFPGPDPARLVGSRITVTSAPGRPELIVVGVAKSITDSADGWVLPAELAGLRAPRTPAAAQMLYRFHRAGTAAQIRADVAALGAALPPGALTGTQSYLTIKSQETRTISIISPFVVAFAVIGLVLSVLIVANVVNGAVVAGYRRIGVLKSIGFTPAQVVAAYVTQAGVPALAGCLTGVAAGNLLSVPLLSQTATVYGVGKLLVPAWVDVAVPAAMCAVTGLAALLPALRAGRLSAVQAIATGRAPRQGHGYAAHRLLGRLRLPRPVTIGLAAPFARPARTAATLAAILFGATAVTLAVGLDSSLARAADAQSHALAEQVQIALPRSSGNTGNGAAGSAARQAAGRQDREIQAALRAQPGTLRYVAEAMPQVAVPGLTQPVPAEAFRGNARWIGYPLIAGRWYSGPGEIVVNTGFLTLTGNKIGDTVTITAAGRLAAVKIVGEVFDPLNGGPAILASWHTLGGAAAGLTTAQYDVGLRPGVSPQAYANAIWSQLGPAFDVMLNTNDPFYQTVTALIGTLTLLLAVAAGLGVLNTVILHTRERTHDLGVFKAIGMTPRQAITMMTCWVAGIGLAAGLIAVPAGIALHWYVLPVMAKAAGTGVPASFLSVYRGPELIMLAMSGLAIAVLGALLPAIWAARTRTATALHAE